VKSRPGSVVIVAIGLCFAACGAETPSAPQTSAPVAVATAEPTPVPTPVPTPTPEPTAEPPRIFPGPVHHVHIKVHAIREANGVSFRRPFERDHAWIVYVGETAIIDATPKNAQERPCESEEFPEWSWEENAFAMRRVASPNPFLLWMEAVGPGNTTIRSTVDGAGSNTVEIEVHNR
jgi:hypothetical protein